MLPLVVARERRKASRYRLQLPVLFSWHDGDEMRTRGGFTRDVSVQGMFVTSSAAPPLRTALNVEVVLPPSVGRKPENIIKARGLVVRVSGRKHPRGFAIAADLGTDFAGARKDRSH